MSDERAKRMAYDFTIERIRANPALVQGILSDTELKVSEIAKIYNAFYQALLSSKEFKDLT